MIHTYKLGVRFPFLLFICMYRRAAEAKLPSKLEVSIPHPHYSRTYELNWVLKAPDSSLRLPFPRMWDRGRSETETPNFLNKLKRRSSKVAKCV